MPHALRFGILTLQNERWDTLVERWQRVEDLGFDSAWVADHFVNPYHPEQPWYEAWALLAALAAKTSRIKIGPLVTPIGLRNPAVLARQAMTVDHISGGRLELGIGAGSEVDPGYGMIGVEVWPPPERVKRLREYVQIVSLLLRERTTTFEGRYYQINHAQMYPAPVQQPRLPLLVAALKPATLKIAAQYADTWNTYLGPVSSTQEGVDILRQRSEMIDGFCSEIGRDPGEVRRSFLVYDSPAGLNPFASVDAFNDFIGSYRQAGMNEFIFYYPTEEFYKPVAPDQPQIFERIAAEVIPKLRKES